jgi:hypothetical protein
MKLLTPTALNNLGGFFFVVVFFIRRIVWRRDSELLSHPLSTEHSHPLSASLVVLWFIIVLLIVIVVRRRVVVGKPSLNVGLSETAKTVVLSQGAAAGAQVSLHNNRYSISRAAATHNRYSTSRAEDDRTRTTFLHVPCSKVMQSQVKCSQGSGRAIYDSVSWRAKERVSQNDG